MAIGTTLKVGFDAAAVRKGFSGLGGMFGGVMRGFRQAGIGAARQVGARMTDMLGRVLMAVPEGIKETLDWAGNLTDMSAQTGVAVEKLVLMEEALRLAGASASDTSRILSTFADNLGEAMREAGPAQEALRKLGFKMTDFKGIGLDEAFEKVGRRAGQMSWGVGELESTMADLFGARMGFKLIRFFRDFDGGMKQSINNVGPFAARLDSTATGYDKMSDALGRFKMRWRETMSIVIDETVNMFGDDWVDQMFDFLSPEKIRTGIANFKEGLKVMASGDFWKGLMNDLGRAIGDGIKASLGDAFSLKGLVPSWMGGGAPTSSTGNNDKAIARMDRQIQLLQTIATKTTGWA
jgi:hypothetical protein